MKWLKQNWGSVVLCTIGAVGSELLFRDQFDLIRCIGGATLGVIILCLMDTYTKPNK